MTALGFWWRTKRWPRDDDLERVNCEKAGTLCHTMCGWCDHHKLPRFQCGCVDYSRVHHA